jgi:endo-1,4-beta-xylanase
MNRRHFIYAASAAAAAIGGTQIRQTPAQNDDSSAIGLKDIGPCGGRLIGAVVDQSQLQDGLWLPLILKNFNLITLGALKWDMAHPTSTTYDFKQTDWVVAFCTAHGLAMHGHNLCWNATTPAWLAQTLTPANAEKMLTDYITLVMKRYAGKITSYDVVNEPIGSWMGRSDGLYTGPWLTALGPDYIDIAFHAAKAADPNALRVLNLAHVEQGGDGDDTARDLTLSLIEGLVSRGVPIQAVGFESHLAGNISGLSTSSRESFIKQVRQLGLQIIITEMDIDDTRVPTDVNQNDADVAQVYSDYLTSLLTQAQPPRVIFFTPGDLNNWYDRLAPDPTYARPGGALHRPGLFDSNLSPKLAYSAVATALKVTCP